MLISDRIAFAIDTPRPLDFDLAAGPPLDFEVADYAVAYRALPAYDGPVVVTPSSAQQVLSTTDKSLYADIVVGPIPDNYGLIAWDGSTLTVS